MIQRVLFVCTGNTCRSQMAEAFLRKLAPQIEVVSAGIEPETRIRQETIEVMREVGIDLEGQYPKDVYDYADKPFDIVISMCEEGNKILPKLVGDKSKVLQIEFDDPASARGTREQIMSEYREVRDAISKAVEHLYINDFKPKSRRKLAALLNIFSV